MMKNRFVALVGLGLFLGYAPPAAAGGSCAHDECDIGPPLSADCSACAEAVCEADSFCCEEEWDVVCVGQADDLCTPCGGATSDSGDGGGFDDGGGAADDGGWSESGWDDGGGTDDGADDDGGGTDDGARDDDGTDGTDGTDGGRDGDGTDDGSRDDDGGGTSDGSRDDDGGGTDDGNDTDKNDAVPAGPGGSRTDEGGCAVGPRPSPGAMALSLLALIGFVRRSRPCVR